MSKEEECKAAVEKLLSKAIKFEQKGEILQSKYHYQQFINKLKDMMKSQKNEDFVEHLSQHVDYYKDHIDELNRYLEALIDSATCFAKFTIMDGTTGINYQQLFNKYFNHKLKELLIEEPQIYTTTQFKNIISFLEFVKRRCPMLRFICISTKYHHKRTSNQNFAFRHIRKNLARHNITVHVNYTNEEKPDHRIYLSSGYVIRMQGGLNIFRQVKSAYDLGVNDSEYRTCVQTRVTISKFTQCLPTC